MASRGTRVCATSTPSKRLVYSRTAAPPRTRTSSVIGLTRSTARSTSRAARGSTPSRAAPVRPAASRPRRSIRVVTGLAPLSEVTRTVYERRSRADLSRMRGHSRSADGDGARAGAVAAGSALAPGRAGGRRGAAAENRVDARSARGYGTAVGVARGWPGVAGGDQLATATRWAADGAATGAGAAGRGPARRRPGRRADRGGRPGEAGERGPSAPKRAAAAHAPPAATTRRRRAAIVPA